jgi:hypothetical protein
MDRFELNPPAGWLADGPRRYRVGAATVTVGELAPLPEDLAGFLGGAPSARETLASGWTAFVAVAATGELIVIPMIDAGVVVRVDAPPAELPAVRAEVLAVLGTGVFVWDATDVATLAELFTGVDR